MKCVIVMDNSLPLGLTANTAAALGLSLGNHVAGLIGPDVADSTGNMHKGITAVPIPILSTDGEELTRIYQQSRETSADMTVIGFSTVAQGCNDYSEYTDLTSRKAPDDMQYLGICIYGPRKTVNSLCGRLKLLR